MLSGPHTQGHRVCVCRADKKEVSLKSSSSPRSPVVPLRNEVESTWFLQEFASVRRGEGACLAKGAPTPWSPGKLTLECRVAVTRQQLSDHLPIILVLIQPPGGKRKAISKLSGAGRQPTSTQFVQSH